MTQAFGNIFSNVKPETNNFQPIPKGNYEVKVEESEIKQTKAGTGFYINLKLKVIDEKCNGRFLFDILNIKNPSEVAVEIGKARLMLLLGISGVEEKDMASKGPDFLIGKHFIAFVGIDKNDNTRNRINGYKSIEKTQLEKTIENSSTPNWL